MKKVHLSLTFTLILGLLVHTVGNSQGTPIFTGNAATDFITTPGYIHFNDFVYDVGLPPAAPAGTVTGWDMQTAFFYYDQGNDDLYVGVDFAGIFGDADGDGDPSTTSSWLSSLQGTDHANLGDTEGFILAFDNGNDGNYDVYIGVSRMEDVTEFGIFVYTSDQDESPELFPVSPVGNVTLHSYEHNSVNPDLEFKVENISDYVDELCGVDFTVFAGSYEDGPIGEDHMEGKLELCLLPIELVSMLVDDEGDGGGKSRKVFLEWTTATENNNDYFEVQHANDANLGFKTIGKVEGSGTKLTPTTYEFFHESPSKGNNYYRLKQVDMDGNEWISPVIAHQYVRDGGGVIDVYPNPNKGEFMLGLPDIPKSTEALIRVIDGRGAMVYEKTIMLEAALDSHQVNTYGLAQGIYHVSLTLMNSQNTYNESFIIR